jgi:hypothetical protein
MTSLLNNHLQFIHSEARELANVHDGEGLRDQLERLMDMAVGWFDLLLKDIERWKQRVASGELSFAMDQAREYEAALRTTAELFRITEGALQNARRQAAHVDPAAAVRFRERNRDVQTLAAFSIDDLLRAERDLQDGKARPLSQVMGELRDRHSS